jgi:hypothetical protein
VPVKFYPTWFFNPSATNFPCLGLMGRCDEVCPRVDIVTRLRSVLHFRCPKSAKRGGIWMLTRSLQIILDKRSGEPKTGIRLLMAGKSWRSIVYDRLHESCACSWLTRASGVSVSCASGYRSRVTVDNQKLCRLNYRVAEATTVFYVKRIRTGGSFPPNVRASSPLVFPLAVPTGWLGRDLSRPVPWFSDIRERKKVSECRPYDGRNVSVKRRFLGPLLFAVQEGGFS